MAFLEASYYYTFDGTGDRLNWPGTTISGDFTVECWAYKTAVDASGYTNVFYGTGNDQFTIDYSTPNSIGIVINGTLIIAAAGTAVTPNSWHHLAWVREGSTYRVYVDGVQQGTGTGTSVVTFTLSQIGGYSTSGYEMNGYLSNVRIVNGTCLYPSGTTFTPSRAQLTAIPGTQLLTCQAPYFADLSANQFPITVVGDVGISNSNSPLSGTAITNYFVNINDYSKYLPLGGAQAVGNNSFGQLGLGGTARNGTSTPINVGSNFNWADVSVLRNGTGTAFLNQEDKIYSTGTNTYRFTPGTLKAGEVWKYVLARQERSYAINTNGTLWSWGINYGGTLGLGDTTNRLTPVQVGTASDWSIVVSTIPNDSSSSAAGIKTNGTLWTWGGNAYGQLGVSVGNSYYTPIQVGTESNWSKVVNGYYSTLAIKTTGTLWAWGYGNSGQLGLSNSSTVSTPVQVGALSNWSEISSGEQHVLAIKTDGTLWGWGYGNSGQLGISTGGVYYSPIQIGSASDWSKVSCGSTFTIALKTNGTIWSTGQNNPYGSLGLSDTTNRNSFVQIGSLSNWSKISAGGTAVLASKTDGTLWFWGSSYANNWGANGVTLGNTAYYYSPLQLGSLSDWNTFSLHYGQFLAIKNNGSLWSWGWNGSGAVGVGDYFSNVVPSKKSNLLLKNVVTSDGSVYAIDKLDKVIYQSDDNDIPLINTAITWTSIDTGRYHFVGIKTDGTAWSLGNNDYGQLGKSDVTYRTSLVQVGTASNWSKVYCSDYGTMLVDNSLNAYTFGKNDGGQLGLGDLTNRSSPVQIAFGDTWKYIDLCWNSAMAVRSDGTLWSWGKNDFYQLGLGDLTNRSSPVQVGTSSNWKSVSLGKNFGIGTDNNGYLWSWGSAGAYLGISNVTDRLTPAQINSSTNWLQVSSGYNDVAAIKTDGTLWTWGLNDYGQLGNNSTTYVYTPTQLGSLSDWAVVSFSTGFAAVAAIKTDGTLWTWGRNVYGQLGLGDLTSRSSPTQVGSLSDWSNCSFGARHLALIKRDGTLWTCGYGYTGALGLSDTTSRSSPVQVGLLSDWSKVSCGYYHTIATKTDGTLWVWGSNARGDLGLNNTTSQSSPVQLGSSKFWKIYGKMGFYNSVFVGTDDIIRTSGYNNTGQLGLGDLTNRSSPIQLGSTQVFAASMDDNNIWVVGPNNSLWSSGRHNGNYWGVSVAVNQSSPVQMGTTLSSWTVVDAFNTNLMINSNGTLWSVGYNSQGTLGLGDMTTRSSLIQVGTLNNWSQVAVGGTDPFTLAIKTDGTLWSWGSNQSGELGLSHTNQNTNLSPVQVGTLSNWSKVAGPKASPGTKNNAMAIKTDGTLWAWGGNDYGQLGLSDLTGRSSPVQVGVASDWSQITAGDASCYGIKNNGTLWAWGSNGYGRLGLGDTSNRYTPTQVGALSDWSKISSAASFSIAVKTDGTLWGMGRSNDYALLVVTVVGISSPVQISTTSNWSQISCGGFSLNDGFAGGVKTDGTLWMWGENGYGQLGLSDLTGRSSPVQVGSDKNWSKVYCGYRHTVAVKSDGSLWSWGYNGRYNLGNYTTYPFFKIKSGYGDKFNSVSTNQDVTFFTKTDGTILSVGNNTYGSLGINTLTPVSSPVQIGTINTGTKVETKNFSSIFLFK